LELGKASAISFYREHKKTLTPLLLAICNTMVVISPYGEIELIEWSFDCPQYEALLKKKAKEEKAGSFQQAMQERQRRAHH